MQRVLAIDPGAHCGWAIRLNKKVMFGTEDFSVFAGVDGRAHSKFHSWFSGFLYACQPELVISEAPIFQGKNSEYLYGFSVILQMLCHERKIPTERVHLATIKKSITGHGDADKAAMIAAIRCLGHDPDDDHQADALALLTFKERFSGDQLPFTGKTVSLKPSMLNTIKRRRK